MILPQVPESIPRKAVLTILEELGLDPKNLLSLRMNTKGIYAEVFALDENGNKIINLDSVAKHNVFIRFD